ncbi:MAG: ArnT family glycosyltransferase [Undibacterium sp.]
MPFLHILLLGFSSAVVAVWFRHHFILLPDNQVAIGLPFYIACVLFASVLFFGFRYHQKNPAFSPRLQTIFIIPLILCFSALIFNTQAFLRGRLLSTEPLIPFANWFTANLSFVTKFGAVILVYLFLSLAFYSAGNFLLRAVFRSFSHEKTLYAEIVRITLGMLVWSLYLVGLGALEALTATPIWTAFFLLFLSEYKAIRALFEKLSSPIEYRPNWKSPGLYLFALLSFLIAFTFTQSLRPHPTGYDDMTFYMDRTHGLSEEHALISGGRPYPFELMAAAIRIAAHDETLLLAMSLATYALFFGALVLYGFGREYFNRRTGLLAAVILLSLPIGAALTIREVKPDPLLFAITTLVFWSLVQSITERQLRFWYVAVTLFSFAVTIKMTALFLVAPIALTGLFLVLNRKLIIGYSWKLIPLTLLGGLLPLAAWIGYGLTTHPVPSLRDIDFLLSSVSTDEHLKLRNELTVFSVENACVSTGGSEDFSRFAPNRSSVEHWITLPWDLTMNLTAGSFATEIGFFFLALIPLWLVRRKKAESEESQKWHLRPVPLLSLFALGYFALWVWLGQGVIWYGYPGLALLILIVAALDDAIRPVRVMHTFFWIVIILGLASHTIVQMKLKAERAQVLFLGGELPAAQFLEQSIAGYGEALEILNQDPTSRILLTSSQLWYGIINNDKRAVMDSYLDTFNCLHRERDDALTLSRLHELNIRYVLYARGYTAELEGGKRESFNAKIKVFTDFIGKNLRVVWGSPYYTLFEVPAETESSQSR